MDEASTTLHICTWAKPPMSVVICAFINRLWSLAACEATLSMQLPIIVFPHILLLQIQTRLQLQNILLHHINLKLERQGAGAHIPLEPSVLTSCTDLCPCRAERVGA